MTRFVTLRNGSLYHYGASNQLDEYVLGAHLGKITRFAGALTHFLSIAQHSIFTADVVRDAGQPPLTQIKALLHDAHESVTSDMPTPYQDWVADLIEKRFGERYDVIEDTKQMLDRDFYAAFGLAPPTEAEKHWIKFADKVALVTEAHQFLDPVPDWIHAFQIAPATAPITPLSPEYATSAFICKYRYLKSQIKQAA